MADDLTRTWRRQGVVLAALLGAVLLIAACGSSGPAGNGVASLGASGSSSSAGTGSTKPSAIAYSRCMRAHGVKDFPDPGSDGEITLEAGPGSDLGKDNPQFQKADAACKSLLPEASHLPTAQLKAATLKYAKCMRAHSISDFPDPKADGTLQIQSTPGGDLDPANSQFQAANKACAHFLPDGGAGGSTTGHGG